MTFDELYGAGTFANLKRAINRSKPAADVTEQDGGIPGTVIVTIRWGDNSVGLTCTADSIFFFQCSPDLEMHEALERALPAAFKALGVTMFHSLALDEESKEMLIEEHPGFEERAPGDDHLDWTL